MTKRRFLRSGLKFLLCAELYIDCRLEMDSGAFLNLFWDLWLSLVDKNIGGTKNGTVFGYVNIVIFDPGCMD